MQLHRENNTPPPEDQSDQQDMQRIGTGFRKIFGSQLMAGGAGGGNDVISGGSYTPTDGNYSPVASGGFPLPRKPSMFGGATMTKPVPSGDTSGGFQGLLKMLMARRLK
jgi:hypothetical protein